MGGWFYGVTHGLGVKNIYLRREQFRLADVPGFCLRLARALVAGKIRNQRTMLQRNHVEPPAVGAGVFEEHAATMPNRPTALDELLGIEGNAARVYFQHFAGMIKLDEAGDTSSQRASPNSLSTSTIATAVRRAIQSTPCCRWPTACWRRT